MLGARIVAMVAASAIELSGHHVLWWAPAAVAQELAAQQIAAAGIVENANWSGAGPSIARVSIGLDGTGVFEGVSAPWARVALTTDGRAIADTVADARGSWRLDMLAGLAPGEHRIAAVARMGDASETRVGGTIRISIPDGFGSGRARAPDRSEDDLLRRAGELADQATRRFDELLPGLTATGERGELVIAQADPQAKAKAVPQPGGSGDGSILDEMLEWPRSVLDSVQWWLESSERAYQSVIVRRLVDPAPTEVAREASPGVSAPVADAKQTGQPSEAQRRLEAEQRREAEAKKAAEAKRLAAAEAGKVEAETRRKAAEAAKAEAEAKKKTAEDLRRQQQAAADAVKAEAEAKRKAAEAQRLAAAEAAKAEAEAKRKATEDLRRQQQAAADAAKAETEAKRKAAEEARLQQALQDRPSDSGKATRTAASSKTEISADSAAGAKVPAATSKAARIRTAARPRAARSDRSEAARAATNGNSIIDGLCRLFH